MLPQPPPTSLATPLSPRNMPLPTAAMFPNVGSGVNLAEAHAMSLPMCLPRTPRRESRVSASNFLNTTNANNNSNSNNSTPGMDGWRLAPRPRVNPASTTTASPRRMIVPRRGQQASSLLAGWSRSAAPNNNINAEVMMMMDGAKQGGLPWLEESVGLSTNGSPVMASPLPVSSGVVGVGGSGGGWANSRRESMAVLTRPVLSQLRFSPRRHRSMGDGVAEAMTEDEDDLVAYGSLAANSSCCTLEEEENHSVPDFISFPMVDDLHCEEVPSGDASPIPIHTPRWRYRNPQRSVDVEGSGVHHVRDGSELRRATGMMVLQPSDSNYVIEAASLVRAPPHRGLHEVVGLATHQRSKSCVSFTNLTAASMHSTGADSASDGTFVPIAVASITSTGDWQALLPRAARQHMRHSSCGSDEGLHYSTTRAKSCN